MAIPEVLVEPHSVTWKTTDLGCTEGDIEILREPQFTPVVCHQTGTNERDRIRTGMIVSVSMTIKEFTDANFDELIGLAGGVKNTSAATDAYGYGFNRDFTSMSSLADVLVLHPLSQATKVKDWNFHLSYPIVESIVYSGEATQSLTLTWSILPDDTKASGLEYVIRGDGDLVYT